MNPDYMREFIQLTKTNSYQETADSLFISISSLSKHISKLEEELGVQLFDRTTRSVQLNDYGVIFLDYAKKITVLFDECSYAIKEKHTENQKTLTLGFPNMIGHYGVVETVAEFSRLHPDISVSIQEIHDDQIGPMLDSGKCDIVIAAECFLDNSIYQKTLYCHDHFVVIMPKDHPLAKLKRVSFEQLQDQHFINHDSPIEARVFQKFCKDYHFEPNNVMNISYSSTIIRLVKQNIGLTIMSLVYVQNLLSTKDIQIVQFEPTLPFEIYAYSLAQKTSSDAKDKFIGFLQNYKVII